MKISWGIADIQSVYGAETTSQTSSKPFTIPIEELMGEKTSQTQKSKNGAVSAKFSTTLSGTVSLYKKCNYDPFKDMAQTGSVNLPDYMQTKTTPTRSDEEILKDIEALAKEHARTGQSSTDDERYLKLINEYVSSVSPDRESLLKNAVTEIHERLNPQGGNDYSMNAAFQQIDSQRTKEEKEKEEREPIDYFLEALKNRGKGKGSSGTTDNVTITENGPYRTVEIDHGGGMITVLNYANGEFASMNLKGNNYYVGGIDNSSGEVRTAEFHGEDGEWLMFFDGNDLYQHYTKAEDERRLEMFGTYNAAFDVAIGRHLGAINSSEVYKEAYNSTYERLTNSTVA